MIKRSWIFLFFVLFLFPACSTMDVAGPSQENKFVLLASTIGLSERFSPAVAAYWARLQAREGFQRAKAAQAADGAPEWQV